MADFQKNYLLLRQVLLKAESNQLTLLDIGDMTPEMREHVLYADSYGLILNSDEGYTLSDYGTETLEKLRDEFTTEVAAVLIGELPISSNSGTLYKIIDYLKSKQIQKALASE